jgi:hypothetical protein
VQTEVENKTSKAGIFQYIFDLKTQQVIALGFVFLSGFVFLWAANRFHVGTFHEAGVLCITITPILFIYESAIRSHLQFEMTKGIKAVINESKLEIKIMEVIKKTMPTSYQNILKLGISDAYEGLSPTVLEERIRNASEVQIRVTSIWIPYLNLNIDKSIFIDSIVNRGCSYQIILCDNTYDEPIRKRAESTRFSLSDYKNGISQNLGFFHMVWNELGKDRDKIQLRVHNDFISLSVWGFQNYYVIGTYLHGRATANGIQLRVDRLTPEGESLFFEQIDESFGLQWKRAYKDVIFTDNGYDFQNRMLK